MGGTKNATTTATQTLPSYLQDAYQGLVGKAQGVGSQGYTPYTGGFTPDQQTAFQNINNLAGTGNPQFSSATTALNNAVVPTYQQVGNYMNPYTSGVVNATMANMNELNGQQQQQVVGNAIAKGAFGGNRVGVAQGELARQQNLANQQTIAGLWNNNYSQALQAAQGQQQADISAGAGLTSTGAQQMQSGLSQAGAQLGAGTQQQQFNYAQYLNQQGFPYQQASWLASIIGGLGSSAGGTTTQQAPQGNIFSQLLGAGLGVASLFNRGGVVRPHAAAGGVMPYSGANDNWPGYVGGGTPYTAANSNFASYIPQTQIASGGGGHFPAIQDFSRSNQTDPLSQYSGVMKQGAGNIRNWLSPRPMDLGLARGGVVPHFANGGWPSFDYPSTGDDPNDPENWRGSVDDLYQGIIKPAGGLVGGDVLPPPSLTAHSVHTVPIDGNGAVAAIDTAAPLDADRLGLGYGNTSSSPPPAPEIDPNNTPDEQGHNQPPAPSNEGILPSYPQGPNPGAVPFSSGRAFTTQPDPQYSYNIQDALKSLGQGKGLNLSPDFRQALLQAGAGMMASKAPFFLQGVGEGVEAGNKQWMERQDLERANAAQRGAQAKTGADIALEAGNTASALSSAAATRYTFTRTPAGVQVTDAMNPSNIQFYRWGQVLPDGSVANPATTQSGSPSAPKPIFSSEAPQAPIDLRLMSPDTVPLATGESAAALTDARGQQQAALAANQQLAEMQHSFDALPDQGWLSQGAGFNERLQLAKDLNAAAQVAGVPPVMPINEIAAGEDLNKVTTRLGFDLSSGLGSNEAASIVNQAVGAVPGGINSKAGAQRIIGALEAINRKRIDYYNFIQDWQSKNNGSIRGADSYFNAHFPPELYAMSAYVPEPAMQALRQHPEQRGAFNAKYGNGRDVARYVLGQ